MSTSDKNPPSKSSPVPKLRVFAGPNGSGKSTIINSIKNIEVSGKPIDFGYYINADDIARKLTQRSFTFSDYDLEIKSDSLTDFAEQSGLLNNSFSPKEFRQSFRIEQQLVFVNEQSRIEQLAQILARYLRAEMLRLRRRFSFETVFSHESNLDIMREAREAGYKVYLYFVSTESPEINEFRVKLRVAQGGHDVPVEKIRTRYFRSLKLLPKAIQLSYQVFCFDNSLDNEPYRLIAHGKYNGEQLDWDDITEKAEWFEVVKKEIFG